MKIVVYQKPTCTTCRQVHAALKESGVDIARRTVAKYREGMNIPSSVQRRREKRALASAGR